MTHPGPYNDRFSNPDDPYNREWGNGSIIAGSVAIVLIAGVIAGAMLL